MSYPLLDGHGKDLLHVILNKFKSKVAFGLVLAVAVSSQCIHGTVGGGMISS